MNNTLTFGQLRQANETRKRLFTNSKGELAHPEDAVQWTRAEWLEAMVGELGEYCNDSKKFRRGDLTREQFIRKALEEIGGTLLYLDLLCSEIAAETNSAFNLGYAVAYEFNRKSAQIGCPIFLTENGNMLNLVKAEDLLAFELPGVGDD